MVALLIITFSVAAIYSYLWMEEYFYDDMFLEIIGYISMAWMLTVFFLTWSMFNAELFYITTI